MRNLVSSISQSLWTKLVSVVCILTIVVLSLLPQEDRLEISGLPGLGQHLIGYGVTGLLLGLSLRGKRGPPLAALLLAGLASLLEFLQQWSPGRHPRLSDAIFSAAAAASGAIIAAALRRYAEGRGARV